MTAATDYQRGFIPYALAAFLVSLVGGFTTMLAPAFVQELDLPYANTTWTALVQAMSTAACAPILGKLSDLIGRRLSLLLGIAAYTLGTLLSALSASLPMMLLARFVVGLGSASITPVVLAYIVAEFPREMQAKGFSLYMMLSSAAVIFGPLLGGLLISSHGWRSMMWVCTALCLAVLLICGLLKEAPQPRKSLEHFDVWGAVLVFVFFSLLLCLPALGQNLGWRSGAFLIALVLSLLSLLGLIGVEGQAVSPILPGAFMRQRSFVLSILALFLTQGLMQANMTNLIVFVQHTQPENQMVASYAISVMYLGMTLGSLLLGPLADRHEPKNVLPVSFALTGISCCLLLLFTEKTSSLLMMASLGLLGFGLGGNGTIFMKVVLSSLPNHQAGTVTGTYGLFRDLSAPLGVAILVPLFTNRAADLVSQGQEIATSAVSAIRTLAFAEIACVLSGIVVLRFLPGIHQKRSR